MTCCKKSFSFFSFLFCLFVCLFVFVYITIEHYSSRYQTNLSFSCVLINGWLSESFQVRRGIRQACPLSALLFILATETSSVNTKQDQTVKWIKVGNELEVKIVQLADDTTVMVENDISVVNVLDIICRFSNVSGITVYNKKKRGIMVRTK